MSKRPEYIDLPPPKPFYEQRTNSPSPRNEVPSPRSGDIPPALSPLDAFAFQGRMLAKKFEEENNQGRRISRLPHLTIANEFGRARQGYFNNMSPSSADSQDNKEQTPKSGGPESSGTNPDLQKPETRPMSIHPFIQNVEDFDYERKKEKVAINSHAMAPPLEEDEDSEHTNSRPAVQPTPIKTSPELMQEQRSNGNYPSAPQPTTMRNFAPSVPPAEKKIPPALDFAKPSFPSNLAPYRTSPALRSPWNQPSIRSVRNDSGDESDANSFLADPYERHSDRKLSAASSSMSRPKSPFSPVFAPARSPSIGSDYSSAGAFYTRQSVNFSRPLSRNETKRSFDSRPSVDTNSPYIGGDSPQMRPSVDAPSLRELMDSPTLPSVPFASMDRSSLSDDERSIRVDNDESAAATSYIYTKYTLPRGRTMSRDLLNAQSREILSSHGILPGHSRDTSEPIHRPSSSQGSVKSLTEGSGPGTSTPTQRASLPRSFSFDESLSSATTSTRNSRIFNKSYHKPAPSFPPATSSPLATKPLTTTNHSPVVAGYSPLQHLGPEGLASRTPYATPPEQISPEDHLTRGIQCHEEGALQKSTYHLRIAARAGLPTAMLLYALACRHGWGMRPNQAEGVGWLRKAVESAGLEVADDETPAEGTGSNAPNPAAFLARKVHKAQLALSIYELGVSYMNGWGIAQDKPLAVRCFEIAGAWGDGDALAESGFCYAKGVGCKKDLRRAAEFYRRAERAGVAMTGNSWIWKEKYLPKESDKDRGMSWMGLNGSTAADPFGEDRNARGMDKDDKKKLRDKSRSRSIFGGRKRNVAQT